MSHADPGPLAAYNSLQDKHLAGYFSNSRMKKHLRKSGLVTRKGKIIDEKTYRLNMAKKEHRKHVRDLLATAIVHKTLDMERIRQYEIRKKLDEVYKVELVRRVKEGRNRKGDEDILPLLSPRERTAQQMHKAQHRERPATAPAAFVEHGEEEGTHLKPSEIYYDDETQKIYYRVDSSPSHMNGYLKDETEELGPSPYTRAYPSTYPAPAPPPSGTPRRTRTLSTPRKGVRLQRFHYLARTEPAVARRVQLQSMAEVTMKFLGPSLVLTNSMFPEDRLSEVMVLQQHCGGSTLCVFRELLPPNTIFTFISRRHRGAPFGLTFYIDGMQDIRLSSCCEYKHKPGHILGGKNGHFQFVVVEGAAPCYRCQISSAHKHSKYKHKNAEGSGDGEDDDRSKTFMTETANEQEKGEQGEAFDVIITKIKSAGGEDKDEEIDAGEMVDHSTQTPRDENSNKPKEMDVDDEKTAASADSGPGERKQDDDSAEAEESGADKYDDEEFEEGPEKDKESESESEAKEETDKKGDEDKKEDEKDDDYNEETDKEGDEDIKEDEKDGNYNEDFESDEEKERDESGDEDGKESEKEEDPEDDIQDETEDKEKSETGEEEQAEEVEDETDKEKQDAERPSSVTDSDGRQSKNVSFDEDVTVIEDEQEEGEKNEEEEENPEDVPEEVAEQNDQEDRGVDKAELESEDLEKVSLESPRQGQDDSRYPEEENKQDDNQEREDTVRSPELSGSSSSSSSDSETSDSEDESKKAHRSKKKKKGKAKSRPGQDPGSDPDLVSSGQLPEQALKAVGVQPGTKHDGSVQSLLGGKEDVELVGVALTKEQFEEVAKIIDSREDLGTVILRNTSADDSVLETLAPSLINAPTLKMLNLSVNRIGPEGAKHLADVITQNKSLRMLLLHGNPLTDEGVGIIVDAIVETTDTSIMNLDLGDCGLTQNGAKHIAKLIEHNSTVSVLTISGNTIQLEGWQNISKSLSTNSTLETLSLDFNKIGDEEAISIAEGIRGCKSLRSVDLEGNKIGDEGGRKLFDAVKANKSIVDLTLLPINQISKEIVDEVKDFLIEREKGNEPEEAGGGKEQHETEPSALQLEEDSGEQGLVTEGGSTATSHQETVNEHPSTQESSEERQEQKENEGVIEVEQGEESPGLVREEQGRDEKDKKVDDKEQLSGDDQQSEKEDSAAEENAAPAEEAGLLPDAEHREHQDVAPAKDDQDGNEPQQDPKLDHQQDLQQDPQPDSQQDPQQDPQPDPQQDLQQDPQPDSQPDPQQDPQPDPYLDPHLEPQQDFLQDPQPGSQLDPQQDPQQDPQPDPQPDSQLDPQQNSQQDPQPDPHMDPQQDPQQDPQRDLQPNPQLDPQQDPQQSENEEGQESPQREQPQVLEDPGESTGQESLGQDKEDKAPHDPAVSMDLGVNDDEETYKKTPSTEEGNDNKHEGLDNETEDELEADASSPSENTQKNSSDAAS